MPNSFKTNVYVLRIKYFNNLYSISIDGLNSSNFETFMFFGVLTFKTCAINKLTVNQNKSREISLNIKYEYKIL